MTKTRLLWIAPVLALLGCTHNMASGPKTTAELNREFEPTVRGKKLLHYHGPSQEMLINRIEEVEKVPFDGLIMGGYRAFYMNEKEFDFDAWAESMRKVPFQKYTDNFYLTYSAVDALDKPDFDWFHDCSWVVDRWRTMARAAKKAGFVGICFDTEHYGGRPLFGYEQVKYKATKTFEEYQAQAKLRGAEIMKAVCEEFPDIRILFLFGYSGAFYGVPQHPLQNAKSYTLISAFIDGMLTECGPGATIHDMHEQGFCFRTAGSYAHARNLMKNVLERESTEPEAYRDHHRVGYSFWADAWGDNSKGRALDLEEFENNFYTPLEMAYSLNRALAYSDEYVWMWPGAFRWWAGQVSTVSATGEEVLRPIPEAYMEALSLAKQPEVPVPPSDRKPNFYRVDSASSWKNWSDEEAFAGIWEDHVLLLDYPETWKFNLDPFEIGYREGWYRPAYDASAWEDIRIREFWEKQGYSPYDGAAWYRVSFETPEVPAGKRVFLVFGGIADEATVYVNGEPVYGTEAGRILRHERVLVDVTDALSATGSENLLAVRVWNTYWCGGLWKGVKLVAER